MAALLLVGGCSWIVDSRADQCRFDGDCSRFPDAMCDRAIHLCVRREATGGAGAGAGGGGSGGAGGSGGDAGPGAPLCRVADGRDGCVPCVGPAATDPSASCTDTTCVPFDGARITKRAADGKLRPLPPLPEAVDAGPGDAS